MSREEFAVFAAALQTYYPRANILPNKQALELWYRQLQDIDYRDAEKTLNKWVSEERFPPSIADIRGGKAGDACDWWSQLRKVQERIGYQTENGLPPGRGARE